MQTLEARVARLEKSARRWRLVAAGACVALLGVVGLGAAQQQRPSAITATRLTLVDAKGDEIAYFGPVGSTGSTELRFKAKSDGPDRVILSTSNGGTSLVLHDAAGAALLTLKVRQLAKIGKPEIELIRFDGSKLGGLP